MQGPLPLFLALQSASSSSEPGNVRQRCWSSSSSQTSEKIRISKGNVKAAIPKPRFQKFCFSRPEIRPVIGI